MEVPHVQVVDGSAVLTFSCMPADMAAERRPGRASAATWTVSARRVTDGWDVPAAVPFAHPSLYSGRLLRDLDGGLCLLGFAAFEDGTSGGSILDPVPVAWTGDRLVGRTSGPGGFGDTDRGDR